MKPLPTALAAIAGVAAGALVVWRRSLADRFPDDVRRFHSNPLGDLLCGGHTTPDDARIWLRAESTGSLMVSVRDDRGHTQSHTIPNPVQPERDHTGVFSLKDVGFDLREDAAYTVSVRVGGRSIGECHVRTTARPEKSPERITIGIASCNNPFNDRGSLSPQATELLQHAAKAWVDNDVHHGFLLGDQVYADLPYRFSLFDEDYFPLVAPLGRDSILDCSASEVRQLMYDRYRLFYKPEGFQDILRCVATHAILDDHEILDNWGSGPNHSNPEYKALETGARDAFFDYQGSRGIDADSTPEDFDQTWVHGVVSAYIFDIRSNRTATEDTITIYSNAQLQRLTKWLEEQADQHVILLGLSVPFLHVPDWMATVGATLLGDDSDAADRWSYFKARKSRDDLLQVLKRHLTAHPKQHLVIMSGDIHVGCINRIDWDDDTPPMYQISSSAITNKQSVLYEQMTELAPKLSSVMGTEDDIYAKATLLDADNGDHNPYGGLNSGLIEVDVGEDTSRVRLTLLGLMDGEVQPVFRSDWL